MDELSEKRFDSVEILNKVLEAVERDEDIVKRTLEILKEVSHYTWVGIYLIEEEDLVLKHYLGRPTEHTRIKVGQGICGAAVVDENTIIVPDVSSDERYLACSAETKSEIVVPIWSQGMIVGEIDIDSDLPCAFDSEDQRMLEQIANAIADFL